MSSSAGTVNKVHVFAVHINYSRKFSTRRLRACDSSWHIQDTICGGGKVLTTSRIVNNEKPMSIYFIKLCHKLSWKRLMVADHIECFWHLIFKTYEECSHTLHLENKHNTAMQEDRWRCWLYLLRSAIWIMFSTFNSNSPYSSDVGDQDRRNAYGSSVFLNRQRLDMSPWRCKSGHVVYQPVPNQGLVISVLIGPKRTLEKSRSICED